jgi:hypothetical protein
LGITVSNPVRFGSKVFSRNNNTLPALKTKFVEIPNKVDNRSKQGITAQQAIVYFTAAQKSVLKGLEKQVDPVALQKHVEYLASDKLTGRLPGTNGIKMAQEYIVNGFKSAGLKPLPGISNENFQQKAVYQNVYHECERDGLTGKYVKVKGNDALVFDRRKLELNNLVGFIPAKGQSDQYIVIAAHYDHLGRNNDSAKIYTGADDNASGIAALLELAKVLSKAEPDKNIVFAATSGEEMGLLGSSHLAKQLNNRGFKGKVQVLNLDCLAAKGDFMTIEGGGPEGNRKLKNAAVKMAQKLGIKYETPPKNDRTDAEAFEKAGFPAITFLWAWKNDYSNRQHYHQPTDRPEIADYQSLYTSTKLALATIMELSTT